MVSQYVICRCKSSWVSYGSSVLLAGLISFALAGLISFAAGKHSVSTSPIDVAVVVQAGHAAAPYRVRAHHNDRYSFLQTWDRVDVRLWRREATTQEWRLFRQWKNMEATWSHRINGELAYIVNNTDGMLELYDASNYELLYRISTNMPPGNKASTVYGVPGDSGQIVVLRVRELDSQGREFYSLHLGSSSEGYESWQPFPESPRIVGFSELGGGLFAAQAMEDRLWRLVRVAASGSARTIRISGFPTHLAKVRRLSHGVFGVALYDASLGAKKDSVIWHLFRVGPRSEILPIKGQGLEGLTIKDVRAISKDFVRLVERSPKDADGALVSRFYRVDEEHDLRLVHEAIPGLPEAMRNFSVLGNGKVVGATEVDDANGNGVPGDWTWRLRDTRGNWRAPHELLPGLKGEIWRMIDWLEGEGLGVQTAPSERDSLYRWHWYMHESKTGRWRSIDRVLPLPQNVQIEIVRDRNDNLLEEGTYIELVAALAEQEEPTIASPVPLAVRNVHYMVRTEDGEWTAVRTLVAEHFPDWQERIVGVSAIRDGLTIKILRSPDETPMHLHFYKNRDRRWVPLDKVFLTVAGRSARRDVRPFPNVRSSNVVADGHVVLLHEEKDANWDGQDNSIQLLEAGDRGWRVRRAENALTGKDDQLRYEPDLGLLVRTAREDGEKSFLFATPTGTWRDIRTMVPYARDARAIVGNAFVFADGRGIGVKDYLDSNVNGRFGEWFFYYRDGELWKDIRKSLPETFPIIHTVIGAGGRSAISVEEEGDSNRNNLANEWRHYYRRGDAWVDLSQQWPDLANQFSEFQVSGDGRILTVREEWDSNGNDLPFELLALVWSDTQQDFAPIGSVFDRAYGSINAIRSLWNGRGMAIDFVTKTSSSDTAGSGEVKVRTGNEWHVFQHRDGDRWQVLKIGAGNVAEVRGDITGQVLALRRQGTARWELWTRKELGSEFVRWQGGQPSSSSVEFPREIRLDSAPGIIAVKTHELWIDGEERWQLWQQDGDGMARVGHSATPTWFGLDHRAVSRGRVRFDNANHYLDGRRVDSVPQPAVWFHSNPDLQSQENILYAPDIISQALKPPAGTSLSIRINALGYGPAGTVIVYHSGDRRLVASFSEGPVWVEKLPLLYQDTDTGPRDLMLLVNRYPDGTERQFRLDTPDRWIWCYRHRDGRIYFDDTGYFFSETNAATEILTFRVGLELYSFAQFGSYLFRPDLLEKRLGVPKHSLFDLTPRDVERIRLARTLAPKGVNIASLKPPHINVLEAVRMIDLPSVDLTIVAEGVGIDETSVAVRILGAGRARSGRVLPHGTGWKRLSIQKRVPLIAGENRLEITVFDAHGLSHSRRLDVTFTPDVEQKPTLYVAVVATARYRGTNSLGTLPLTQRDARTIAAAFNKQKGLRFKNVILRTWCQDDNCSSRPTRQRLVEELPDFVSDAKDGDYIVVYVSGHGLKIENTYYMVPEDGDPRLPDTLVAWSQIHEWLQGARLGKKMVLLDTCYSGAVFHDRDRRRLIQQAVEDDGIYVLSAAAADAAAYELLSLGNGIFTHVLREGLEGPADTGDGIISFEELSHYVAREVRSKSSAVRIRMEPDFPILDQDWDFSLAHVNARKQLFLRVNDISTDKLVAKPGRRDWWKCHIEEMDNELSVTKSRQNGIYELVIVEDNKMPIRSTLSASGFGVLEKWSFSKIGVDNMLQALIKKLATHHQEFVVCGSRGAPSRRCRQ